MRESGKTTGPPRLHISQDPGKITASVMPDATKWGTGRDDPTPDASAGSESMLAPLLVSRWTHLDAPLR